MVREIVERPTSTVFGAVFKVILIVLAWVIFLFIIALILSLIFQENVILGYVYDTITDPLMNTGIGLFFKNAFSYLKLPFSSEAQAEVLEESQWKSYVEKDAGKDLGVKIDRFEASRTIIPVDYSQSIEAIAKGSILTLEDSTVQFSCLVGNNIVEGQGKETYVYADIEEFFTVECVYNIDDFVDLDRTKETDSQKIKLKASYPFSSRSDLIIYTLDNEIKNEMKKNKKDFFVGINNPYLKDDISYPVCTEGPVKFELQSLYSQPLTDKDPNWGVYEQDYTLSIKINDNQKWTGVIESINEIYLMFSDGLDLADTDKFEEVGFEDKLKVYRLKDFWIDDLYTICKSEKENELIDEDCWRAGNLEFTTHFKVKQVYDRVTEEFIRAEIDYKYGDIKQDTITFINT